MELDLEVGLEDLEVGLEDLEVGLEDLEVGLEVCFIIDYPPWN